MFGLSVSAATHEASRQGSSKNLKFATRRAIKAVMRSHRFKLPKYDLPLRLRPYFIAFTATVMLILAFLGVTNFARALPLNDTIIHLVCLCVATILFYFIFDVEEEARRIWIWRHASLILTSIFCFLFGGVISEVVQSLLPNQRLELGDIAANLIGSAIGLWTAYYLERWYRHRREIARLYRPVAGDPDGFISSDEDDEERIGTQLLPLHRDRSRPNAGLGLAAPGKSGRIRLGDVWDEREELFGIGDSSDEEGPAMTRSPRDVQSPISPLQHQNTGPKIIVTPST